MKLSHGLGLAGIGLCVVGAALSVGCSSSGGSTGGGGGDSCEGNPGKCVVQPAAPSGPASTVMAAHNYAMRKLYLGDTDRMGVSNTDAWKNFGYNLDDKITTKDSTDVCTLAQGTQKVAQSDGTGGIDNSFGENILPIVLELGGSDLTTKLNTDINSNGAFTIMAYVKGFDDSKGSTQTATGLSGVLLAGGPYSYLDAGAPPWNTMTHWPIRPDLINGCTSTGGCPAGTDPVKNASIQFPSAYVSNGTFVNGTPSTFDLSLTFSGQVLDIKIHSAIITFQANGPGSVTNGTIAGVINTSELNTDIMNIAGHISTSLCSGSALQSIQQTISQASDIIINSDGSVANTAGTACNGISIGLGFDATEVAAPASSDIMPPSPAAPNPCTMGGSSDAGTGAD